jgi:alpha-glucosidase (family GH31 glycosyl hydrolase)
MKRSLIGMIEFNWFGIPYNGADICGFDKTPTEEMCIRLEKILFSFFFKLIFNFLVGCKSEHFIHFLEM